VAERLVDRVLGEALGLPGHNDFGALGECLVGEEGDDPFGSAGEQGVSVFDGAFARDGDGAFFSVLVVPDLKARLPSSSPLSLDKV
jgi:hypothetical protein